MFWWLMYSRAEAPTETLPLIIWIGGGPGAASTGYGNIEEIGPFNYKMEPRNITWVCLV
jgi:serine carboxypeptidase 1